MNILQIISSDGFYGAEAMLVELARNSTALGCNSYVAAFRDSRHPHIEVVDQARRSGVPAETIPCYGRWDRNVIRRIRLLIAKHRIDLLHLHGYKADFYGMLAAWPSGLALLSTCHSWPSRQLVMRAYAALDRRLLRNFDRIVPVSDSVARILLASGARPDRIKTIPNGVGVKFFDSAPPTLTFEKRWQGKRLIGFVGRLVECKGGAVLLDAAREVVARHPNTMFVFVGEGPQHRAWQAMAERWGIAEHVAMLGVRTDMPGIYASLDMLVLPSFAEATPMCVLEALAARKPVVATAVGGVPDLVIPGMNGMLVETGDAAELSAAILRLIEDPELARRMGVNGNSHVRQHFSAETMARAYVKQYHQAVAERIARSRDWAASAGCAR
jgi:glycosyltransferase involved in cell wall biosynthesis